LATPLWRHDDVIWPGVNRYWMWGFQLRSDLLSFPLLTILATCEDMLGHFKSDNCRVHPFLYFINKLSKLYILTHQMTTMFGYRTYVQFKQIPQSEDCETVSHETEKFDNPKHLSSPLVFQLFAAILLIATLIFGTVLGAWLGRNRFINANEFCIHKVSRDCNLLFSFRISKF
jgi:hypothetical protein